MALVIAAVLAWALATGRLYVGPKQSVVIVPMLVHERADPLGVEPDPPIDLPPGTKRI